MAGQNSTVPRPDDDCKLPGSGESKLGMRLYLSLHRGFCGKIKSEPADFRVTEIDQSGRLVSLETGTDGADGVALGNASEVVVDEVEDQEAGPHRGPAEATAVSGDGEQSSTSAASTSSSSSSPSPLELEKLTFDDQTDLASLPPLLSSIVGEQTVHDLREFAESELAGRPPDGERSSPLGPELSSPSPAVNPGSRGSFSIGEIVDKTERALVHKAVQCLYPHLRTSVARLGDGGGRRQLLVAENPAWLEFNRVLASAAEAGRIVRFSGSPFSGRAILLAVAATGDQDSKERRTALHRLVAKHYGKFLESKTVPGQSGGRSVVAVRFREKYAGRQGGSAKRKADGKVDDKSDKPVYTGFTLKKENQELLDTLQQLARMLRNQASDFSYAGVKDKKAITVQSVAVKGIGQNRFQTLIKDAKLPGVAVGNARPRSRAIRLGELTGNHFDILIRDVQALEAAEGALMWPELDSCFQAVKEKGFLNYFGEQRFGVAGDGESQSAAIGRAILMEKYEEAIRLILSPDGEKDDPVNAAKRHYVRTRNPSQALARMPRYKSRESLVLRALRRHGLEADGCARALLALPHTARQFYVHAFCSLVWNAMASRRLEAHGYQVVAGDLVLRGDETSVTREKIFTVTTADVQDEIYSIRDVVLPLPGNSIQYPGHSVGRAYAEYLEEAGLGSCAFRVTELQLNIPGSYRRLFQWPGNLQWRLQHLTDGEIFGDSGVSSPDKHPSSDLLVRAPLKVATGSRPGDSTDDCVDTCKSSSQKENSSVLFKTETSSQGADSNRPAYGKCRPQGTNVRVQFDLPLSTYATVFLREVMKS